jgi:hypothetical protein
LRHRLWWRDKTLLHVRRRENAPPQCATDVGHHALQQRIVGRPVVDEVITSMVVQVCVDAPLDGPDGIDLVSELRPEEFPGDGL